MGIVKRQKGNKKYFYLKYSYRKGNEVITKEKYLGKKIPKNINVIRQELAREGKEILYKKLEKIKNNFQKELERLPDTIKEKEKEEIAIAFTYNTNAIEGSKIALDETRGIIHNKIAPNKSLSDIKETDAHAKVFFNMLNHKEKMSNNLILRWHKEIFGETKRDIAGRFRDYLVRVGDYIAPDWEEVKKLMNEFINFVNKSKLNPVELAGKAHYKFERIHPLGDGNGRIGRLIMNYVLWHKGYPMLIFEYKKRKSYYRALEKDEEGFINYFLRRYLTVNKKRYL